MKVRTAFAACAATTMMLTACAGGGAGFLGLGAIVGDRNLAHAEPLFSHEEQRCLGSVDQMIALVFGGTTTAPPGKKNQRSCREVAENLRFLLERDDSSPTAATSFDVRQRNEFIDALIASSNQKCIRYSELIKNADGAVNAGLSVGAIVTGGLGSILPGAGAARALAGSSSILSGSRAALNETYLSNQTIHVLTAAYDKARRAKRRMITNREACSIEQYTMMRGLEDALDYHDSCSIIAGLAETALSIERSENPGLSAMRTQLNELTNMRRQMAELTKEGPVSPIAPPPTPASLDKVIAAEAALATAHAEWQKAEIAKANADKLLTDSVTALAAGTGDADAVAKNRRSADQATATLKKLAAARDDAAAVRNAQVHALVRVTTGAAVTVEPETRSCPFT